MYALNDILPFPRVYRSWCHDIITEKKGVRTDNKTENSTFDSCKIEVQKQRNQIMNSTISETQYHI